MLPFASRREAGRLLAARMVAWAGHADPLVLALPRGGVPIACEIAQAIGGELDLMLVRKLGAPINPELAMGAIAMGGVRVLNRDVLDDLGISAAELERVTDRETHELERRAHAERGARAAPRIAGRDVVLVDDGVATGATMRAAIAALREQDPARISVAVPVAPPATVSVLEQEADEVICLATPADFGAIARFYRAFPQVGDEEVRSLLSAAWATPSAPCT